MCRQWLINQISFWVQKYLRTIITFYFWPQTHHDHNTNTIMWKEIKYVCIYRSGLSRVEILHIKIILKEQLRPPLIELSKHLHPWWCYVLFLTLLVRSSILYLLFYIIKFSFPFLSLLLRSLIPRGIKYHLVWSLCYRRSKIIHLTPLFKTRDPPPLSFTLPHSATKLPHSIFQREWVII